MELYDVMRTTGAVRRFTDDPLPDEVLERILDNARFAPSGGNRQGTRVIVVRDPNDPRPARRADRPGCAPLHRASYATAKGRGIRCSRCGSTRKRRRHRGAADLDAPLRDAPVPCWWSASTSSSSPHSTKTSTAIGVIAGASVYPFVWNILLAARNEGYGGVLTTIAVAEEPRVKELLGIPGDYAIAALLPMGKPVRQLTKLTRKPVAELASRERFDGEPFNA